jgi:hypothetical protein
MSREVSQLGQTNEMGEGSSQGDVDQTAGEMARIDIKTMENYDGYKADQLKERLRVLAERARGSGFVSRENIREGTMDTVKRSSTSEAIAALRRGGIECTQPEWH